MNFPLKLNEFQIFLLKIIHFQDPEKLLMMREANFQAKLNFRDLIRCDFSRKINYP